MLLSIRNVNSVNLLHWNGFFLLLLKTTLVFIYFNYKIHCDNSRKPALCVYTVHTYDRVCLCKQLIYEIERHIERKRRKAAL